MLMHAPFSVFSLMLWIEELSEDVPLDVADGWKDPGSKANITF